MCEWLPTSLPSVMRLCAVTSAFMTTIQLVLWNRSDNMSAIIGIEELGLLVRLMRAEGEREGGRGREREGGREGGRGKE